MINQPLRSAAALVRRSLETRGLVGALALIALCAGSAAAGAGAIGPDDDLCAARRALLPGDELVLGEGGYRAGSTLRHGGEPGRPVVVRAADPARPHQFVYEAGHPLNMLEIRASDVVIRGLHFWGGRRDHDGILVVSGHRITVEDCQFSEMDGVAVAATHTSVRHLTVRGNVILDPTATAMYFGCHDRATCAHTELLVERNVVRESRTSSGIVVAGGPVVVRNNVSAWNVEAGIGLENYHHRDLLRGIVVAHNPLYKKGARCRHGKWHLPCS